MTTPPIYSAFGVARREDSGEEQLSHRQSHKRVQIRIDHSGDALPVLYCWCPMKSKHLAHFSQSDQAMAIFAHNLFVQTTTNSENTLHMRVILT
jgi:hypothetical protein